MLLLNLGGPVLVGRNQDGPKSVAFINNGENNNYELFPCSNISKMSVPEKLAKLND